MKKHRLLICILQIAVFVVAHRADSAQTQNQQAQIWFEIGLETTDVNQKISAFQKAVDLDGQFIEAFYQLGLAYKAAGQNQNAEALLQKASRAKTEGAEGELKLKVLLELTMVQKRLNNVEAAIETLQQARALARDSQTSEVVLLELGTLLLQQNRPTEALVVLRGGEKIAGVNSSAFAKLIREAEQSIRSAKPPRQVEDLFAEAVHEQTQGNLSAALALFKRVQKSSPGYRDLAARITEIEDALHQNSEQTALDMLYEQATKYEAEGNLELAVSVLEDILARRSNFKDAVARLESVRARADQQRIRELIDQEYRAGLAALRDKNWVRAIFSFEKVLEYDNSHRGARARLRNAQQGLDSESAGATLPGFYTEGLLAMKQGDFVAAITAFEKVQAMDADYRDVGERIAEARTKMEENSAAAEQAQAAKIDSLQQKARLAKNEQNWAQAVACLEVLQGMMPEDEALLEQLAAARARLKGATGSGRAGLWGSAVAIAGGLAAVIILPVTGVLVFSPAARARLQLLRGRYNAAASIYEKMIARNPGNVKLYPVLANLYLLTGRQDDSALKFYKTVLQLDLPVQDRERMHSFMAQQYIAGDTADGDTIEILEKELQKEISRKKDDDSAAE